MRTRLLATAGLTATLVLSSFVAPTATAAPAPDPGGTPRLTTEIDAAVAWLATQQQADGGFEVSGFAGFETPDAVLALAAAGQSEPGWNEAEALAAVQAVTTGGKDALDSLDDWVDGVQGSDATAAAKAQQAAKVIVLVTEPLGLAATDFDPSADSASAVNLVTALTAGAGGASDYATLPFGGRVYAAWALAALGQTVPAPLLAAIAAAQQANGSFDFSGDPGGSAVDPDLTASVIMALTAAGQPATNTTVRRAAIALGWAQRWNGEWAAPFDDGNPNSTSQVMVAAATLGSDPESSCWRDRAETRFAGVAYPSPSAALLVRQVGDGHITSPSDTFGLNTFATSQAVQGLAAAEGAWPYRPGTGCTFPSPSNPRRLVNAHYVDLLHRFSDEAGAAYWVGLLDGGAAPALVSKRLTGTPEYARRVVDQLYRTYLGRSAGPAERAARAPAILAGRRLQVIAAILGSDEYYANAVSPSASIPEAREQWAEAVFQDLLGRSIDLSGRDWVLQWLEDGRTRAAMARALLHTPEVLGRIVDDFYRDLLRRLPDPAGRLFWIGRLQAGRSPEALVLLIAGSPEYVIATSAFDGPPAPTS